MLKLLIANFKLLIRNRQSLFWSLAFPLIFTVIFGFFYSTGSSAAGSIAVVNSGSTLSSQGLNEVLNSQTLLKVKTASSRDDAVTMIKKEQVGAAIIVPEDFGASSESAPKQVVVLYDPGAAQTHAAVQGLLSQYFTQANYQLLGVQPVLGFSEERANTSQSYEYFDYVLIGLIGMALMNSSVQGIAITMASYRETKILKRITITPLRGWKFVTAEILSRLVLNIIQISLIIFVGTKLFTGHITGSLTTLVILSAVAAVLFQLVGFAAATFAKDSDSAQSMSTAITIPMMFLSGVFFPIDQLPHWLYSIVKFLPLSPLLQTMRDAGLQNISPFSNWVNPTIVATWIVALLFITIYRFKLLDD